MVSKNKIAELSYEEVESPTEGKIVLVPDFETFEVKLIVADTSAKYSTTIPIDGPNDYILYIISICRIVFNIK